MPDDSRCSHAHWTLAIGCRRLVAVLLLVTPAVVWPLMRDGNRRPSQRACFANAVTLEGAIEMYDLDHGTRTVDLDAVVFADLKREGYLQTIPDDPDGGSGSHTHYRMFRGTVFCLRHGFRRRPGDLPFNTPARIQLLAAGCTDRALLDQCSTRVPFPRCLPHDTTAAVAALACWLAALTLLKRDRG